MPNTERALAQLGRKAQKAIAESSIGGEVRQRFGGAIDKKNDTGMSRKTKILVNAITRPLSTEAKQKITPDSDFSSDTFPSRRRTGMFGLVTSVLPPFPFVDLHADDEQSRSQPSSDQLRQAGAHVPDADEFSQQERDERKGGVATAVRAEQYDPDKAQVSKLEQQLLQKDHEIADKDIKIAGLEGSVSALTARVDQLQAQVGASSPPSGQDEITRARDEGARLKDEELRRTIIADKDEEIDRLKQQLEQTRVQSESRAHGLQQQQATIEQLKRMQSITPEQLQQQIDEAVAKAIEDANNKHREEIDRLNQEHAVNLEAIKSQVKTQIEEAEERYNRTLDDRDRQIQSLQEEMVDLRANMNDQITNATRPLREELDRRQAEIDRLNALLTTSPAPAPGTQPVNVSTSVKEAVFQQRQRMSRQPRQAQSSDDPPMQGNQSQGLGRGAVTPVASAVAAGAGWYSRVGLGPRVATASLANAGQAVGAAGFGAFAGASIISGARALQGETGGELVARYEDTGETRQSGNMLVRAYKKFAHAGEANIAENIMGIKPNKLTQAMINTTAEVVPPAGQATAYSFSDSQMRNLERVMRQDRPAWQRRQALTDGDYNAAVFEAVRHAGAVLASLDHGAAANNDAKRQRLVLSSERAMLAAQGVLDTHYSADEAAKQAALTEINEALKSDPAISHALAVVGISEYEALKSGVLTALGIGVVRAAEGMSDVIGDAWNALNRTKPPVVPAVTSPVANGGPITPPVSHGFPAPAHAAPSPAAPNGGSITPSVSTGYTAPPSPPPTRMVTDEKVINLTDHLKAPAGKHVDDVIVNQQATITSTHPSNILVTTQANGAGETITITQNGKLLDTTTISNLHGSAQVVEPPAPPPSPAVPPVVPHNVLPIDRSVSQTIEDQVGNLNFVDSTAFWRKLAMTNIYNTNLWDTSYKMAKEIIATNGASLPDTLTAAQKAQHINDAWQTLSALKQVGYTSASHAPLQDALNRVPAATIRKALTWVYNGEPLNVAA